jgi:tetratricopeptide (TPR) repeat protein
MKTIRKPVALSAFVLLWGLLARAQAPLAQPLADFDKLVAQLKTSSVVGEPIRAGDTAVIPFAKIKFALGGGEAMMGFGGGMDAKTIPLGILIVEGDDVRAELFPEQEERATVPEGLLQAIRDRKFVYMVNGLNIGNTSGTIQDMAPLISAMMGQTTIMVNGLNLGNLNPPASVRTSSGANVDGAIADLEAAIAKKPSAEAYYHLGEAWKAKGADDKAAAAYRKALELQPNYPEASKALAAIKK